jgi:uncharacterized membrane protein (UPF0127 family)
MNWLSTGLALLVPLAAACGRDADPSPPATLSGVTTDPQAEATPSQSVEAQVIFESESGPIAVTLEVVSTPAKIQRGLMHRRHLAPKRGMLFVFSSERVRSFWMKNTLIPLDMLFVKEDMTIAGIQRDTVPLSLESRSVSIPAQYVIEVNGGFTARHGIEAGSRIVLKDLPEISNAPL